MERASVTSDKSSRFHRWAWGAQVLWQHGLPEVVISFLGGAGDDLLCTAPIHEWLRRGARRIWFISRHPSLHRFDRRVRVLHEDAAFLALASKIGRPTRFVSYSKYNDTLDRDTPLTRPLIAEMCALAGLQGDITLRPRLSLNEKEIEGAAAFKDTLLVQSSGLTAAVPMLNKQWHAERIQGVVEQLSSDIRVVQIGSIQDPPLKGVLDLRGKTAFRETAAMLHQARLFFGMAGFPMHLARAVDCPAVIIYGGREPAELTGYPCNINLSYAPDCAPCWQRNRCDHDRVCLGKITVDESVSAIRQALSIRRENPLAVAQYRL